MYLFGDLTSVQDSDFSLQEVYQKIMQTKCPVAPVMENGKFIGIVDKENIAEFIMVKRAME
jgi:predicted transcriptional regulator